MKSPVRRIHKVKTDNPIKETFSDEGLEFLRDSCNELRDLAMVDVLASTGMRVGELVNQNREDINFFERECVVFGKGGNERVVYFNARTLGRTLLCVRKKSFNRIRGYTRMNALIHPLNNYISPL